MSNEVYANGMEVSCKQAAGKTICAFPDVCFTPPENPATPPGVPVPYPNTGMASDCSDGSSTVKISGQEAMLKDKSYFKKSSGDEAGCAAKKNVINSKNTGKVYFGRWSMNVKIEGNNAVRHMDITTGNHASPLAGESCPWPHIDAQTMKDGGGDCKEEVKKEKKACKEYKPYKKDGLDVCDEAGVGAGFTYSKGAAMKRAKAASADKCSAARRCRLVSFNATPQDGVSGCCPAQTPDHLVPKSSFFKTSVAAGDFMEGWEKYKINEAPCMCLEGGSCSGSHGLRHAHHKASSTVSAGTHRSFDSEVDHCAKGAKEVAPQCSEECIKQQLKEGHKGMGDQRKKVKYSPTGRNMKIGDVLKKIAEMLKSVGGAAPGA